MPGYGFSGEPTEVGWNFGRVAQAWAELMRRLGYTRYVAQGGDVGAAVTDAMGRQAPEGLAGIHMNLLVTALGGGAHAGGHRAGTRGARADQDIPGERLRLLPRAGHAAADDRLRPAGFTRSPWRPGCSTTTPTPTTRSPAPSSTGSRPGGSPGTTSSTTSLLYWLTGTGASAARSYWENGRAQALAAGQAPPPVKLPVGFTTFPGEIFRAPRSWVEKSYPNLTYFNEADRGGHFAAWEEPELFATEIRAAFRPLR